MNKKITLSELQVFLDNIPIWEQDHTDLNSVEDYQKYIVMVEKLKDDVTQFPHEYIDSDKMITLCLLIILFLETGKTVLMENEFDNRD